MQVQIDDKTIQRLKKLFPVRLEYAMKSDDADFFADFMATIGIDTINALLEQNPGLTFGELTTRYSSKLSNGVENIPVKYPKKASNSFHLCCGFIVLQPLFSDV
jgi:hypothetical protein